MCETNEEALRRQTFIRMMGLVFARHQGSALAVGKRKRWFVLRTSDPWYEGRKKRCLDLLESGALTTTRRRNPAQRCARDIRKRVRQG